MIVLKWLFKRHWASLCLLLAFGWFVCLNRMADTNPDIVFLRSYPQSVQKVRGILVGDLFEGYAVENRFGYTLEYRCGDNWTAIEGHWPRLMYELAGRHTLYTGYVITFDLSPFGERFEPGEYRLRQLVIAERDVPITLGEYPETTMEFTIR